eukprot:TRINITY_DN15045_c0_g1_i1.p1 TRINITY_DN15045_c0_g1~~TRINITY_DN15045_c0_g1_i1.p1  ORF type:complete len:152 (-),score=15.89 TRINITY_DN15045_c0_g1_i1:353-784(-)
MADSFIRTASKSKLLRKMLQESPAKFKYLKKWLKDNNYPDGGHVPSLTLCRCCGWTRSTRGFPCGFPCFLTVALSVRVDKKAFKKYSADRVKLIEQLETKPSKKQLNEIQVEFNGDKFVDVFNSSYTKGSKLDIRYSPHQRVE